MRSIRLTTLLVVFLVGLLHPLDAGETGAPLRLAQAPEEAARGRAEPAPAHHRKLRSAIEPGAWHTDGAGNYRRSIRIFSECPSISCSDVQGPAPTSSFAASVSSPM